MATAEIACSFSAGWARRNVFVGALLVQSHHHLKDVIDRLFVVCSVAVGRGMCLPTARTFCDAGCASALMIYEVSCLIVLPGVLSQHIILYPSYVS